jgi:DNA mismatch repair protein MutS2
LAEALNRLEEERVRVKEQLERLHEQETALAEHEHKALAAANRLQANAEAERERLRSDGSTLLAEVRREGAAILSELKSGAKGRRELDRVLAEATAKLDVVAPPRPAQELGHEEPLKVGDQVELGDIRGELLTLEPGKAVIARGGLRIEVAPERLRRARLDRSAQRQPYVTFSSETTQEDELNLVGARTREALRQLEQFLDQAYLTNQREVRVVHGIGSGALKKAIQDYLLTSPYCMSFRQAEPHQGGPGATIVEIGT